MKTFFKSKAVVLVVIVAMALACKKNETILPENYDNKADTTGLATDTISSDTTGTAGATGEGSTGSGAEGTTEKGTTNIRTDSTSSTVKK